MNPIETESLSHSGLFLGLGGLRATADVPPLIDRPIEPKPPGDLEQSQPREAHAVANHTIDVLFNRAPFFDVPPLSFVLSAGSDVSDRVEKADGELSFLHSWANIHFPSPEEMR
jgi:hypothetical protein